MATAGTSGRRRERAPKPLSVPVIVAGIGLILFFLGIAVASVDVSGLGVLFFLWGVSSFSILFLTRRRRSTGVTRGNR
jgi:hypothetical protein